MNNKFSFLLIFILLLLIILFWKPVADYLGIGGGIHENYRTVTVDCTSSTLSEAINSTNGYPTRIIVSGLCEDGSDEIVITQDNIILDGDNRSPGDRGEEPPVSRSIIRGTKMDANDDGSVRSNQTIRVPENRKNIAFTNLNFEGFNLHIEKGGVILSNIDLKTNGGIIIGENNPIQLAAQINNENPQFQVVTAALIAEDDIDPEPSGENCSTPPTTDCNDIPSNNTVTGSVKLCNSVEAGWLDVTSSATLDIVGATLTLNNTETRRNTGLGVQDSTVSIWEHAPSGGSADQGEVEIRGDYRVGMFVDGASAVVNLCDQAQWKSCENQTDHLLYKGGRLTCERAGCSVPESCE